MGNNLVIPESQLGIFFNEVKKRILIKDEIINNLRETLNIFLITSLCDIILKYIWNEINRSHNFEIKNIESDMLTNKYDRQCYIKNDNLFVSTLTNTNIFVLPNVHFVFDLKMKKQIFCDTKYSIIEYKRKYYYVFVDKVIQIKELDKTSIIGEYKFKNERDHEKYIYYFNTKVIDDYLYISVWSKKSIYIKYIDIYRINILLINNSERLKNNNFIDNIFHFKINYHHEDILVNITSKYIFMLVDHATEFIANNIINKYNIRRKKFDYSINFYNFLIKFDINSPADTKIIDITCKKNFFNQMTISSYLEQIFIMQDNDGNEKDYLIHVYDLNSLIYLYEFNIPTTKNKTVIEFHNNFVLSTDKNKFMVLEL